MTRRAFILGAVPLIIATGAGAGMRWVLGTTVFLGMLDVALFGPRFTPPFYLVCHWLGAWRQRKAPVPGPHRAE